MPELITRLLMYGAAGAAGLLMLFLLPLLRHSSLYLTVYFVISPLLTPLYLAFAVISAYGSLFYGAMAGQVLLTAGVLRTIRWRRNNSRGTKLAGLHFIFCLVMLGLLPFISIRFSSQVRANVESGQTSCLDNHPEKVIQYYLLDVIYGIKKNEFEQGNDQCKNNYSPAGDLLEKKLSGQPVPAEGQSATDGDDPATAAGEDSFDDEDLPSAKGVTIEKGE